MKVPQLRKKPEKKSCHNTTWEDDYSWIHQKNILDVLKDKNKAEKNPPKKVNVKKTSIKKAKKKSPVKKVSKK